MFLSLKWLDYSVFGGKSSPISTAVYLSHNLRIQDLLPNLAFFPGILVPVLQTVSGPLPPALMTRQTDNHS